MTREEKAYAFALVQHAYAVLLKANLDCGARAHARLAYWMLKANMNLLDPWNTDGLVPSADGGVAEWYDDKFGTVAEAAEAAFGLLYRARELAEGDKDGSPLSTWLFDVLFSATDAIERRYDPEARW